MLSERDKLRRVLAERNRLIDKLDRRLLTKEEFHSENYRTLCRWQMKPYPVIRSLEEGIYNYQYYNTLAKEWQRRAGCAPEKNRTRFVREIRNFFCMKDACILQMLQLDQNERIEAYFVHTASIGLRNRLLEIVYPDREKIVLHTLSPDILQTVQRMGVFTTIIRRSRIHDYINTRETEEVR